MTAGEDDPSCAYGRSAGGWLDLVAAAVPEISDRVAEEFYQCLGEETERARIIGHLTPEEFASLQMKLAEYVRFLLSADLSADEHHAAAAHLGRVHGMVGIRPRWLIQLHDYLHATIRDRLASAAHEVEARKAIMDIVSYRIFADIQGQLTGYEKLEDEISAALSRCDDITRSATNFSDLMNGVLDLVSDFEGGISAFFARLDEAGDLQIEGSSGADGRRYHLAMMAGDVPKIRIAPDMVSGLGPGGRAWRSGRIVCSDAWAIETANRPWHKVGVQLGFRSSAAVPILDDNDRSIALLSLYSSVPGLFSAVSIYNFLLQLQRSLSHAVQRMNRVRVVPLNERQTYRRLLDEGRMVGYFQPIIDLASGTFRKLEVLARLVGDDGHVVDPHRFLPAFGSDELFTLLAFGLDEGVRAYRHLAGFDPKLTIAINFPAEGMADPKFTDLVFQKICGHGLLPHQVQLEILEESDGGIDDSQQRNFLKRIRNSGIRIAEDDLGSGYSSLLRLDQFGFDDVKIDQRLVRSAMHRPERALEFILYLTRLAHSFGTMLTVEGLENPGMVEAAAILGADFGQGFAIARPMPLDDLTAWQKSFAYAVRPEVPQTAIGALAAYLTWCLQTNYSQSGGNLHDLSYLEAVIRNFISARKIAGTQIDRLVSSHFDGEFSSHDDIKSLIVTEFTDLWRREMVPA